MNRHKPEMGGTGYVMMRECVCVLHLPPLATAVSTGLQQLESALCVPINLSRETEALRACEVRRIARINTHYATTECLSDDARSRIIVHKCALQQTCGKEVMVPAPIHSQRRKHWDRCVR